jgi:DNA-binding beta-propeller fold protein YncE
MQNLIRALVAASIVLNVSTVVSSSSHVRSDAQKTPPLELTHRFKLPDSVKGHFDHFVVDAQHNRLFATAVDDKAVLVVDLVTGVITHRVTPVDVPRAVLYRADLNRIYVSDGGGALRVFDATNFHPIKTIELLVDADPMTYDAASKQLFVVNGGEAAHHSYSDITIIDTTEMTKGQDLKVEGEELEGMAVENSGARLFVNNRAKNQIEVVDRSRAVLVATWPVTQGKGNTVMALDESSHRMFVACRGGQLIVFDLNTGKELQSLPIAGGVDDISFDPASNRIYVACGEGEGSIYVYHESGPDSYQLLGKITSAPGAATARLVPELNEYITVAPAQKNLTAEILVYKLQ